MEANRQFRSLAQKGHHLFRRRRVTEAIVLGLSLLLPIFVLAVGVGMLLRYTPWGGWLVPGLTLLAIGVGVTVAYRHGMQVRLTYEQFLRFLERKLQLGKNELVNADELETRIPTISDPLSRGLAAQAVEGGRGKIAEVSFRTFAPTRNLTRPATQSVAAAAIAIILLGIAPDAFRSSLGRLLEPGTFDLPPEIWISVEPGDVTIQRGEAVRIRATLPTDKDEAQLFWRTPEGAWKNLEMVEMGTVVAEDASSAGSDPEEPRTQFALTLSGVAEETEYAVASGSSRSDAYKILVTEPLRALGYRKGVNPPSYTGLESTDEVGSDGNFSAVVGSRVTLGVETSREEAGGRLVFADGSAYPLEQIGDGVLSATLPVKESLEYRVELTTPDLERHPWKSGRFRVDAVADRMPTLYQLAPERTIQLPPEMIVDIDVDCLDDFGLTRLDLVYQRNDKPIERVKIASWQGERETRVVHPWDLEGIALAPGDIIKFHLELTDNDAVSGPKTTRGPECEVRFPTLEEMYANVDEERDDQTTDLAEMRAQQEELREELDKTLMELKRSKDMSWEQQESLKDLAERQEKVSKQIEKLADSLDKSLDQMQQAELFSPEMLQKAQEIQELASQIESDEFRKQMEELRQAMEKLDKKAVEKSLEQMQLTQQDLEQSLDRTLQLLQRLQAEENLDRLVQEAQRMVEQQKKINEQLAQAQGEEPEADAEDDEGEPSEGEQSEGEQSEGEPSEGEQSEGEQSEGEQSEGEQSEGEQSEGEQSEGEQSEGEQSEGEQSEGEQSEGEQSEGDQPEKDSSNGEQPTGESPEDEMTPEEKAELQKKQDELKKQLEELMEQLAELQKEAEENWEELSEEMKAKKSGEKLDEAQKNMEQSSSSMPSQPKESLKFGREAEQELQDFAQQMQEMQEAMGAQEQEDITRKLYFLSGQLVQLSQNQEGLLDEAPSRSTRDLAERQSRVAQGAKKSLDELYELGRQSRLLSPELGRAMGSAVRNLEGSTRSFEKGNRQGAMAQGRASTNTLNKTVIELLDANQKMCDNAQATGSCNNPMGKMRSLSSQQEKLNGQSQEMLGQKKGQGQKLGQAQGQSQRLEEMAARQEMIRRGLEEVQGSLGDRNDVLGRLDELAKEMEEVTEEMRKRGEVDERILERQQKILSRLLTAQKSIRREDHKDERTARTGTNPNDRESPPPLTDELTQQDLLRRGILRGSQDPVPDEYRSMVEEYFESLSEKP